ncbi:HAD family hydrolase [Vibrio coralliilyticus]|uniref:HAD family hydrolase n=1 Tax=Vibrio coralliilyticus TaxID=190893 RepID=A0A837GC83_9VIBR|nr:HAD family phosphatase [Vibrio coralliilyticus]KJY70744.1 HAD family hydrolase [Vibrio coralliilyticus]QOU31274.1 HAD family phosphatase [Vibrio coralliilyticus]
MVQPKVRNIVFDVGNVIVRWDPLEITRRAFVESEDHEQLAKAIFQSQTWADLNKGLISETKAKTQYQQIIGLSERECELLFYYIKQTQRLIVGSVELIQNIKSAGYGTYALTDNVHEIVSYLKSTYSFWSLFDGAVVSADVGMLKPQPEIYHLLLNKFDLIASETVFIDDMLYNVEGAKSVGMYAIQFEDIDQCEKDLVSLGLNI